MASDNNGEPLLLHYHLTNGKPTASQKGKNVFKDIAKWCLKVVMWFVFAGWVAMFFVIPSTYGANLYNDYVGAAGATLFSTTGCVLLLYSGPIILIAILAVPYLLLTGPEDHIKPKTKKQPSFRLKTFPVLVDGIFGVVTAAEFIGIALFVAFVLWAEYAYTVFNFEMLPTYGSLTPLEKRVQMLQLSAYCFGLMGQACLAFLFLPIARGSILLRLIDIPFEHATKYHIWLGNLTMFLLSLHGLCYFIVWFMRGIVIDSIIEWKSEGGANFAGIICYSFGFLMWITSIPPVRKRYFEIFYYTHHLYILFILFFALHTGDTNFAKAAGGIFLFMLDHFLRFCQSRRTVNVISATSFPCGSVSLVVSKPKCLQYNALGFVFIQLKEISWLQWHPFSVSSSPLDGRHHLSVLIKVAGDWTTKLKHNVSNMFMEDCQMGLSCCSLTASVEGPYGHETPYHLMYEKLILVARGSGISPFLAILSDILHRIREDRPCLPRNILLIWAVKKSSEISLLSIVNIKSLCPFYADKVIIDVRIFVTREVEPSLEEGKPEVVMGSSFSRQSKGRSMSVLVGTGNKIWAGIHLIVPTLGFVFLLAMLDVYYINPYDVTYWWYKGLLFLLLMVISVVLFDGLVVGLWLLWERKTTAQDEEDMENSEKKLVMHNNGTVAKKESSEECISSLSTICYGSKPDFGEIFEAVSDSWGPVDVGVIVCGPKTLQTSVAKECRSKALTRRGNGPIFHFNSHSFSL